MKFRVRLVEFANLFVQCPKIVEQANQEKPAREEVDKSGDEFAEVKAVNSEKSQKRQENPRHRVAVGSFFKVSVGRFIHSGNQKRVDQPADAGKPKREKVDGSGDGAPVVEAVGSGESEKPVKITDWKFELVDAGRIVHGESMAQLWR